MNVTALSLLALVAATGAPLAQTLTRPATQLTTNLVPPRTNMFESYGSWNIVAPKRAVAGDAARGLVHTAQLVHMTYMVLDANGTATYAHRRSTDGGYTWNAPQTLFTHQSGEAMHGEDTRLACWDHEVYFVFTSSRGNPNNGDSLFLLASDDQGQSWQGPLLLSTGTAVNLVDVDFPEIATSLGRVHVVFEADSVGATNEDVFYTSAGFVGGTLSIITPETRVSNANPQGAVDVDLPDVSAHLSTVTIVWQDDRLQPNSGTDDPNNVFSKTSAAHGTDFATVAEVNHTNFTALTPGSQRSYCAVHVPDVYVLMWDERSGGGYDELNLDVSNDFGVTWQAAQVNVVAPTVDTDDVALAADGSRVVIAFNDDRSGANDTYVVVDQNSGADILAGTQAETHIGLRQGIWVANVDMHGDVIAIAFEECANPANDGILSYSVDGGMTWASAPLTRGGSCRRNTRDLDEARVAVTLNRDISVVWASEPLAGGNALNKIYAGGTRMPVLNNLTAQSQGLQIAETSPSDVGDLALVLLSWTGTSWGPIDPAVGSGLNLTFDSLTLAGLGDLAPFLAPIAPNGLASFPTIPNLRSVLGRDVWAAALTWDLAAAQFAGGTDPMKF